MINLKLRPSNNHKIDSDLRGLVYLATPYSDPSSTVRRKRFKDVTRLTGILINRGYKVFSPITHTHPITVECDMKTGFAFWEEYDRTILAYCTDLFVYTAKGYEESVGVKAEIRMALEMDKRVIEINGLGVLGKSIFSKKRYDEFKELGCPMDFDHYVIDLENETL